MSPADDEECAGCHFFVSILAPHGLAGIEPHLSKSEIPLQPYQSQHNGQVILRASESDSLRWSMVPSDTAVLTASGALCMDESAAEWHLRSLSNALSCAGFPHQILLDDPAGHLHAKIEHQWTLKSDQ